MGQILDSLIQRASALSSTYSQAQEAKAQLDTLPTQLQVADSEVIHWNGQAITIVPIEGVHVAADAIAQQGFGATADELRSIIAPALEGFSKNLQPLSIAISQAKGTEPPQPSFFRRFFGAKEKMWPEAAQAGELVDAIEADSATATLRDFARGWAAAHGAVSSGIETDATLRSQLASAVGMGQGSCTLSDASVFHAATRNRYSWYAHEINKRFDQVRRRRALALLAGMDVDKLREATKEKIVLPDSLAAAGITTVKDVLESNERTLSSISGIGENTARRMLGAAQSLFNEGFDARDIFLGSEAEPEIVDIVALVGELDKRGEAESSQGINWEAWEALRPTPWGATKVFILAHAQSQLDDFLGAAQAAAHAADVAPVDLNSADKQGHWQDYLSRPAHYQALVSKVLGSANADAGLEFLDKDTIEAIRSIDLDASVLKDLHLRGYQSFGAKFAVVQKKILLGDEMGLGKTVQALAAAAHVYARNAEQGKVARILIVAPASLLINWERETTKFSVLATAIAHGSDRQTDAVDWNKNGGVLITNFESLKSLELEAPTVVIVDEAHMIKNPQAQRSQAVAAQIAKADYAMLMTGTPIENRLDEFAQLIGYVQPEEKSKIIGMTSAKKFKQAVAPYYLRRNQQDVLDELPRKVDNLDWVELSAADQEVYKEAIASGNWMSARRAAMLSGEQSAKLLRMREIVEEAVAQQRNVLIFSYFRDVLEILATAFSDTAVGVISGDVAVAKRQELVDALGATDPNTGQARRVLLAQITAGGVGLNIQHSSVVIMAEVQVKPSLEDQAIARAHRMGQTQVVQVHRIVGKNTVDERLLELTASKRKVFDEFARESDAAQVPDATDVSELQLSEQIMAEERKRLGLDKV